jgi:hypothetical protein
MNTDSFLRVGLEGRLNVFTRRGRLDVCPNPWRSVSIGAYLRFFGDF